MAVLPFYPFWEGNDYSGRMPGEGKTTMVLQSLQN